MNKKKIIIRIIVCPFIFGILTVSYFIALIKHFWGFILHGGEFLTYTSEDPKKIEDIYKILLTIKEFNNINKP